MKSTSRERLGRGGKRWFWISTFGVFYHDGFTSKASKTELCSGECNPALSVCSINRTDLSGSTMPTTWVWSAAYSGDARSGTISHAKADSSVLWRLAMLV